jgi:hypothetical protein
MLFCYAQIWSRCFFCLFVSDTVFFFFFFFFFFFSCLNFFFFFSVPCSYADIDVDAVARGNPSDALVLCLMRGVAHLLYYSPVVVQRRLLFIAEVICHDLGQLAATAHKWDHPRFIDIHAACVGLDF